MSKILVNPADVVNGSVKAASAQNTVNAVANSISAIKNNVDSSVLERSEVGDSLSSVVSKLSAVAGEIQAIISVANNGAMGYQSTENGIVRNAQSIINVRAKNAFRNSYGSYIMHIDSQKPVSAVKELDSLLKQSNSNLTQDQKESLIKISNTLKDLEKAGGIPADPKVLVEILGMEYTAKLEKIFGKETVATFMLKITDGNSTTYRDKRETSLEGKMSSELKFEDIEDFGDKLDDKLDDLQDKLGIPHGKDKTVEYYDDKTGQKIDEDKAPKFYDREAAIAETSYGISVSASLFENETKVGEGGTISAVVCKAEAGTEFSAGMYVIAADGTRKLSPGVKAEIGTSFTAFEVEWEQQIVGNEMLGLNSDVTVTAGKADAKAEAVLQIFGQDGKIDLQTNVGAKAELIGGEVEGSIGVNVLGGEVGVQGSVNYGIGAHADIGVKDGVIKCGIGASVGLGVSVGVEVDVGGMVNTVVDAASTAWNYVSEGWSKWTSGWGW